MKKLFLNFMTIVFAMSLVLVSCDPKNGNNDTTTPDDPNAGGNEQEQPTTPPSLEEQGYTVANAAFGIVYPDYGSIDIQFASETDTLQISFISSEETLPVGEYTMDNSGEYPEGTWDPEYTWLWNAENEVMVIDGTVSVTKAGRNYTVKADCIDENGDSVKWVYTGQIELTVDEGYSNPYYGEEETEDQSLTLSTIKATYYGDYFGVGVPFYYIYLTNANQTAEVTLYAFGNSSSTAAQITSGTYNVVAAANIGELTLLEGSFDGETAEEQGHFVYGMQGSNALLNDGQYYTGIYYFTGGSLTINKEAEDNYTITGTLTSALGTNIEISCAGVASITDKTTSSAPAKKSIVAKQGKKLNKRLAKK